MGSQKNSSEAIGRNAEDFNFSPMRIYFKNKNIFLTGGTGFLGLLYVEKLLRSDVKMIYLLIRSKKNVIPADRIKELYSGLLFNKLAKYDPNYLQRIRIIEGDLSQLKLGINDENLEDIYNNVDIILHAAAEVRFDEKLIKLLLTNLRGTRELLKLCEKIKNLEVLTYISTAYSNCYRKKCDEIVYDSLADPNKMIEVAEKVNTNSIATSEFEILTDQIIKPFPNTYTFSKSLAESLVKQYAKKLPVCIIRPSIVISTHEDPIPAWCNNIYGLNGVVVGIGMGMCRLLPTHPSIVCDIVCADFVINSSLAATWYVNDKWINRNAGTEIENPQVFHVNTSIDRPIDMGDIKTELNVVGNADPPYKLLWKFCTNMTTCPFMWRYLTICYHVLPGIIFDCLFSLTNKKLRILPIYRKTQRFLHSLRYFMQNEWKFTNTNMKNVWDHMSPYDQEFYPSDVRRFHWNLFAHNYVMGLRKFLVNENMEKNELARKNYKKLTYFHYLILCIYYGIYILLFMMFANYFSIFGKIQNYMCDTIDFLKSPHLH